MKIWVDWNYWKNTWRGEEVTAEAFNRLTVEAQRYVDRMTFRRVKEPTEDVKNAVCAIIELMHSEESGDASPVLNEKIDQYSVTYAVSSRTYANFQQKLQNALMLHLGDSGLLYRGVER